MKEQLVSQELYDLLKEKGYDMPDKQNECPSDMLINKSGDYLGYVLPTLSLVQKWMREVHKIHVEVTYQCFNVTSIYYTFIQSSTLGWIYEDGKIKQFKSYESGLEEGLLIVLKLIES